MPAVSRRPLHTRRLAIEVFERDDGLFDVEAQLSDVKAIDMQLRTGLRPAGEPIHDMGLSLVVDRQLTVIDAQSATRAMPYPGFCDEHGQAYRQLIGLNLLQGFRAALKQRLGGTQGCTHLSELAGVLPTAVIQALAGHVLDTQEGQGGERAPYQLDRCHALRREGPVVKTHYPRWHIAAERP
jgi:Protein of unknown function (DUF2889)